MEKKHSQRRRTTFPQGKFKPTEHLIQKIIIDEIFSEQSNTIFSITLRLKAGFDPKEEDMDFLLQLRIIPTTAVKTADELPTLLPLKPRHFMWKIGDRGACYVGNCQFQLPKTQLQEVTLQEAVETRNLKVGE